MEDPVQHYVGGIVTKEFLEFSKQRGEQGVSMGLAEYSRQRPDRPHELLPRTQGRMQVVFVRREMERGSVGFIRTG